MNSYMTDLQVAVFAQSVRNIDVEQLFDNLFGEAPSSTQRNKFPHPQAPFLAQGKGVIDDITCDIQIKEGRIDVYFTSATATTVDQVLPSLNAVHARNIFLKNYAKSFQNLPGIYRQAVVVNNGSVFDDERSAIKHFYSKLGLSKFDNDIISADLQFVYNKRKLLKSQWWANQIRRYNIEVLHVYSAPAHHVGLPYNMPGLPVMMPPIKNNFVFNENFDVNIAPTGSEISLEHQIINIEELFLISLGSKR